MRQVGICSQQAFTTTQSLLKSRMKVGWFHITLKLLYWRGLLLAVPSLQVASSDFLGPELNSRACCLEAFVRSIRCKAGALLSSWRLRRCPATVICRQHLWEAACLQRLWIFWPYLSIQLVGAHSRCCRTFKLINCIPRHIVIVFHLEWRLV